MTTEQCMKGRSKHSINTVFYVLLENTLIFTFLHVFLILNENICLGFLKIWRTNGNEMQHSCLSIVLFINCRSDYNPRSRCSAVFKERAPKNLHTKCVRAHLYHSGATKAKIPQLGPGGPFHPNLTAQPSLMSLEASKVGLDHCCAPGRKPHVLAFSALG